MLEFDHPLDGPDSQVALDSQGKIIDFINPAVKRPNTQEERIRQLMVQMLHRELGYPLANIGLERPVYMGCQLKHADIVVFNHAQACATNDQGQIFLIIECKSPQMALADSEGQLISYLSATSAQGGCWTNGNKLDFYRKNASGEIVPWLGLPKFEQAWDSIGQYQKTELIVPFDLKLAFRRCHNALYRSGIDSEDIALDMVRIILAKIEDETSASLDCAFHITPEEFQTPLLRDSACARVRALFQQVKSKHPDVFYPSEEITASNRQLALVISQLQPYSFLDSPHDVIGTAYETYVASHLKGEHGQYFTNRLVVNMMVKMADPSEHDTILDPACGSGGFLLATMHYIFDHIDSSVRSGAAQELLKRDVVHRIFGLDISPKLIKIAKANMLLGKDGHTGIEHANSLDLISKLSRRMQQICGKGQPTLILTNPPFGSGYDLRIKDPEILMQYQNGHQWELDGAGANAGASAGIGAHANDHTHTNANAGTGEVIFSDQLNLRTGVAPELLFLERCIDWVAEGGIVGIVMAKGQLDNREALAVRYTVLHKAQLLAVINLHEDTFEPFCSSRASVLFLQKKAKIAPNYRIFMAISQKIGQTSRGSAIFKRDAAGKIVVSDGLPVLDEDLSEIAADYQKFKAGTLVESEFRFTISSQDLEPGVLSFNPVHYLPQYNAALQQVLALGDRSEFELKRLGDIASVFNGPRFKRPYADVGVTSGPHILKYFTGTALTQLNGDNVKYLDASKASAKVKKYLQELTIHQGYILVSDSGTLGRISYALKQHDGHVATNNLIRVIIKDEPLRGYVYEFLQSELGQSLLLKNAYGTNQEHLEPEMVAALPIPIPKDRLVVEQIGGAVLASIRELENSLAASQSAHSQLAELLHRLPSGAV